MQILLWIGWQFYLPLWRFYLTSQASAFWNLKMRSVWLLCSDVIIQLSIYCGQLLACSAGVFWVGETLFVPVRVRIVVAAIFDFMTVED